jgi:hypothetical protein
MFSNASFSKSDVAMIVALLACATATMIEAHNRILISPPAEIDRSSGAATWSDLAADPTVEPALRPYQLMP